MKIFAPHFFDVSVKERRFVFVTNPEKPTFPQITSQETMTGVDEEMEIHVSALAYDALKDFLLKNPEISEFFESSDKKSSEDSLWKRAFQCLNESLYVFLDKKNKSGETISKDTEREFVGLMAKTICLEIKLLHTESELRHQKKLNKIDPLTNLPNRRAFDKHLKEEIARSERNGPLCLIIFDLDQFKQVNDTHGHLAGDNVLKELAKCFRAEKESHRILRDSDFVARIGGDELVLLLPNTNAEGGCIAAHRIAEAVSKRPFEVGRNGSAHIVYLSASIGVSEYEGREKDPDGSSMINKADDCLYIMKGEKPDADGVTEERRGRIACNGRIIKKDELYRILENNPQMRLPVDIILFSRERVADNFADKAN